jgi:hypothetical protein
MTAAISGYVGALLAAAGMKLVGVTSLGPAGQQFAEPDRRPA